MDPFHKGVEILKKAILPVVNPYLAGNFAPIQDELVVEDLQVIGEIPKNLTGIYMRNGPNPQFPTISYTYPYDGDGMIHAVYIDQGKARYRNRYVETKALLKERRAGKALYSSSLHPAPIDPEWADPEDEPIAVKNGDGPVYVHVMRNGEDAPPEPEPVDPRAAHLTARQVEVLGLIAEGLPAKSIAARLQIAEPTVRNHIRSILLELGCHSQLEALAAARRRNLL